MKITNIDYTRKTKFNVTHRRDKGLVRSYQAFNLDGQYTTSEGTIELDKFAEIRFYATKDSTYCCLWVLDQDGGTKGTARTKVYGVDQMSAALEGALINANIKFTGPNIAPLGETGIRSFIAALARFYGIEKYTVVVSHP